MNSDHKMLENAIAIDEFNRAIALINSGVGDINSADRSGATLLMRAVVSKDLARVKEFIKMGANVNSLDRAKFSALHFAAQDGSVDIASVLIEAGANINAKDEFGNTPLLRAPSVDSSDGERIIDLLLKNGANAKEKNNYGVSYEDLIRK